jgi:hypothetical protein
MWPWAVGSPVAGRASDVSVEVGEDFEATVEIRRLLI